MYCSGRFPFIMEEEGRKIKLFPSPTFPVTDQLITDGPTHHVLSAVLFDHAIHPYRVPEVTIPTQRMQDYWVICRTGYPVCIPLRRPTLGLTIYWPKEIMHRSWKRLMSKCKKIYLNNHVIL